MAKDDQKTKATKTPAKQKPATAQAKVKATKAPVKTVASKTSAKPPSKGTAQKTESAKRAPSTKTAPQKEGVTTDLGCFANRLRSAEGSRKVARRVGRGTGSGYDKTAGRGHKGQKSRSGSKRNIGFEGGQMPLQMRLPKFGFSSRIGRATAKVRLGSLSKLEGDVLDLESLRASKISNRSVKRARVFLSGTIDRPITVRGISVTKGARLAIEKAGGKVEEVSASQPKKSSQPKS